jgi:hypothetical protein
VLSGIFKFMNMIYQKNPIFTESALFAGRQSFTEYNLLTGVKFLLDYYRVMNLSARAKPSPGIFKSAIGGQGLDSKDSILKFLNGTPQGAAERPYQDIVEKINEYLVKIVKNYEGINLDKKSYAFEGLSKFVEDCYLGFGTLLEFVYEKISFGEQEWFSEDLRDALEKIWFKFYRKLVVLRYGLRETTANVRLDSDFRVMDKGILRHAETSVT